MKMQFNGVMPTVDDFVNAAMEVEGFPYNEAENAVYEISYAGLGKRLQGHVKCDGPALWACRRTGLIDPTVDLNLTWDDALRMLNSNSHNVMLFSSVRRGDIIRFQYPGTAERHHVAICTVGYYDGFQMLHASARLGRVALQGMPVGMMDNVYNVRRINNLQASDER